MRRWHRVLYTCSTHTYAVTGNDSAERERGGGGSEQFEKLNYQRGDRCYGYTEHGWLQKSRTMKCIKSIYTSIGWVCAISLLHSYKELTNLESRQGLTGSHDSGLCVYS